MPIKQFLIGGVIISGLILASFLVYVDNFSPYFQQNANFYTARRFAQNSTRTPYQLKNSTFSRLLISAQPPKLNLEPHRQDVMSEDKNRRTSNQSNSTLENSHQVFKIVIDNNMTSITTESYKELLVQNRNNQTKELTTAMSLLNSTAKHLRTNAHAVRGGKTNSTQELPKKLDHIQQKIEEKTLPETNSANASAASLPSVLKDTRHFDRPNPDLSGYVMVPDLKTPLDIHCSSCAIVSSSGQMLGTKAGPEIDNKTCVIRMNDAPVKKYDADVGTRTTIRVLGHSASSPIKNKQRSLLLGTGQPQHVIMWGPERNMRTDGKGYGYNTVKQLGQVYKGTKFYILTQKQMDYADKTFEEETGKNRLSSGSWLTTGWFTIQLARNICDEIHMYGMISDDYCKNPENAKKGIPYHYYNKDGGTECKYYNAMEGQRKGAHRFVTEKNIYARWSKLNPTIQFHHPEWEPADESTFKIRW